MESKQQIKTLFNHSPTSLNSTKTISPRALCTRAFVPYFSVRFIPERARVFTCLFPDRYVPVFRSQRKRVRFQIFVP
jgi:hypothetical protein